MNGLDPGVLVVAEAALRDRIRRERPVLVLFYADWCGFCAAFVPTFAGIAPDLEIDTVAANISHPGDPRWDEYAVEAVPTLVAFERGVEIARLDAKPGIGVRSRDFAEFARPWTS